MGNHLATRLNNKEVSHEQGFDLGRVKDCGFNTNTGEVEMLVVDPVQKNMDQIQAIHELAISNGELIIPARLISDDSVSERIIVGQ